MDASPQAPVTVRLALKRDIQAVVDLQETLFAGDVNQLSPEEIGAEARAANVTVLVADLAGGVCGFLVLRERPYRPWTGVDFVGVAQQATGCGIGGKLLDCAFAAARRPLLRLFVRPSNAGARALYARHGLRHTATRKANYADGEDALVLMKWLGFRPFRDTPSKL